MNVCKRASVTARVCLITSLFIVPGCNQNGPISYHKGWPVTLWGSYNTWIGIISPVIADLDGDHDKELIVTIQGNPSRLVILTSRGLIIANTLFPYFTDPRRLVSVADINNDGLKEIVIGEIGRYQPAAILVFNNKGTLIMEWPTFFVSDDLYGAVVVEDINQDGNAEIVFGGWCLSECPTLEIGSKLVVLDNQGNSLPGFPVTLENRQLSEVNTPAVGNLDDDANLEILVVSHANKAPVPRSTIWAFKSDGSMLWTQQVDAVLYNDPVMGDIDNDGYNEIAFSSSQRIFILDRHGEFLLDRELIADFDTTNSPIALADLDMDGDLELVFGMDFFMYAIHHDGSIIFRINTPWLAYNPPIVGDINGDGSLDIMMNVSDGNRGDKIYAWDTQGAVIFGFPITIPDIAYSSPSIDDIDGDGDLELITSSTWLAPSIHKGIIHVWDIESPVYEGSTPWPMFHHDVFHTGRYDKKS